MQGSFGCAAIRRPMQVKRLHLCHSHLTCIGEIDGVIILQYADIKCLFLKNKHAHMPQTVYQSHVKMRPNKTTLVIDKILNKFHMQ